MDQYVNNNKRILAFLMAVALVVIFGVPAVFAKPVMAKDRGRENVVTLKTETVAISENEDIPESKKRPVLGVDFIQEVVRDSDTKSGSNFAEIIEEGVPVGRKTEIITYVVETTTLVDENENADGVEIIDGIDEVITDDNAPSDIVTISVPTIPESDETVFDYTVDPQHILNMISAIEGNIYEEDTTLFFKNSEDSEYLYSRRSDMLTVNNTGEVPVIVHISVIAGISENGIFSDNWDFTDENGEDNGSALYFALVDDQEDEVPMIDGVIDYSFMLSEDTVMEYSFGLTGNCNVNWDWRNRCVTPTITVKWDIEPVRDEESVSENSVSENTVSENTVDDTDEADEAENDELLELDSEVIEVVKDIDDVVSENEVKKDSEKSEDDSSEIIDDIVEVSDEAVVEIIEQTDEPSKHEVPVEVIDDSVKDVVIETVEVY